MGISAAIMGSKITIDPLIALNLASASHDVEKFVPVFAHYVRQWQNSPSTTVKQPCQLSLLTSDNIHTTTDLSRAN